MSFYLILHTVASFENKYTVRKPSIEPLLLASGWNVLSVICSVFLLINISSNQLTVIFKQVQSRNNLPKLKIYTACMKLMVYANSKQISRSFYTVQSFSLVKWSSEQVTGKEFTQRKLWRICPLYFKNRTNIAGRSFSHKLFVVPHSSLGVTPLIKSYASRANPLIKSGDSVFICTLYCV